MAEEKISGQEETSDNTTQPDDEEPTEENLRKKKIKKLISDYEKEITANNEEISRANEQITIYEKRIEKLKGCCSNWLEKAESGFKKILFWLGIPLSIIATGNAYKEILGETQLKAEIGIIELARDLENASPNAPYLLATYGSKVVPVLLQNLKNSPGDRKQKMIVSTLVKIAENEKEKTMTLLSNEVINLNNRIKTNPRNKGELQENMGWILKIFHEVEQELKRIAPESKIPYSEKDFKKKLKGVYTTNCVEDRDEFACQEIEDNWPELRPESH